MAKEPATRIYGIGRHSEEYIDFGIGPELLKDFDEFVSFIRGCEQGIRKDDRYTDYVRKLHEGGLNKCAIMGELPDDDMIKLEMHHGPIFTLFDVTEIITRALIFRGKADPLTSFDIADTVLTEHELDNIQVVMLSETVHHAVHKSNDPPFIALEATFGHLDRFIERWHDGMEEEHFDMIERYLKEYRKVTGSLDSRNLFAINEQLKNFK